MPLLRATAEMMSDDMVEAGVIEEIINKDDLFAVLPFKRVDGKAYVYKRENTISRPQWISPVTDTVPEGASDFSEEIAYLRVLAGDVDVDKFLQTTMSDLDNQWALQMQMKVKGMAQEFRETLMVGDNAVDANRPDGLPKLIDGAGMSRNIAGGAPLDFAIMDELEDAVANGADAFMMREGTLRAYKQLLRTSGGGNDANLLQLENFGRPVLTHSGIPIIVNNYIPDDEDDAGVSAGTGVPNMTSIYALRLNEVDGFHGIYGGPNAGIQVEEIGTVQDKDATRTRVKWYVGFALKSTKSCARVTGIQNV